jgi:hypothetical protein
MTGQVSRVSTLRPGRRKRLGVAEYLRKPESMRPMELVYGIVREPPAPRYGHQSLLTHLGALLDRHVRELHREAVSRRSMSCRLSSGARHSRHHLRGERPALDRGERVRAA